MDFALKDKKDYEKYGFDENDFNKKDPKYQKGRPYFGNTTGEPFIRGLDIDYAKPISYDPNDYGFDYFLGTSASLDQAPFVLIENNKFIQKPVYVMGNPDISRLNDNNPKAVELGVSAPEYSVYHVPDILQKKALDIMDGFIKNYKNEDKPFFLYYPNHLINSPIIPQKRFKGKSGLGGYGDFVLQLDSYVGELVDELDDEGTFEDTIFIFT